LIRARSDLATNTRKEFIKIFQIMVLTKKNIVLTDIIIREMKLSAFLSNE